MNQKSGRLMFVHAHPDDETLNNGATMAKYLAEGSQVTLVTCTSGEEGEVLIDDLAHLAATADDTLGDFRRGELAQAMSELGVHDIEFLGGPGRYRDSGMMGTPANDREECFWRADLLAAAKDLVPLIRDRRPQVLVTYDDFGGYGHPDHIQAHRVATYAVALAASPTFAADAGELWQVSKVYWNALPRGAMKAVAKVAPPEVMAEFTGGADVDDLPFLVPDELVTAVVDGREFVDAKLDALRAHRTQVDVETGWFGAIVKGGREMLGFECYRLAWSADDAVPDDAASTQQDSAVQDPAAQQSATQQDSGPFAHATSGDLLEGIDLTT